MWPWFGTMWLVVAGTILAPVSATLTGTATDEPRNTWPFFGARILMWAVLLGRGPGVEARGWAVPFEHAAAISATARAARIVRLAPCLLVGINEAPLSYEVICWVK